MKGLLWGLALLLGVAMSVGRASAEDAAEIAQLKQVIADLQKRLQALEEKQKKETEDKSKELQPVQAGFGKLKVDGLMQNWFLTDPKGPQTFRMRRMELKLVGSITPKTQFTMMIDPARQARTSANVVRPLVVNGINQAQNVLQESYITYTLNPKAIVDIGQFKIPLTYEGLQSSAQLDTIERARFINDAGYGDIREQGLQLRGTLPTPSAGLDYWVGIYNGSGDFQNATAAVDQKSFIGRLDVRPEGVKGLTIGASGVYAPGSTVNRGKRDRFGGHLIYKNAPHTFKVEYMTGHDSNPTVAGSPILRREGWYAHYGHQFSPQWEGVLRYDFFDPDRSTSGAAESAATGQNRERDWIVGANYYLKGHNAKLQFNLVRRNVDSPSSSRTQFFMNWQTAW